MFKRVSAVIMLIGFAIFAYCQGEPAIPEGLQNFCVHLEFLGYTVSSATEKSVNMIHKKYPNEKIMLYGSGVLFSSYWELSEDGKNSVNEVNQFTNDLNKKSVTTKYYLDDDKDLILEAWFPGTYDKERFALFVEKLQRDWDDSIRNFQPEFKRFIE